MSFIGSSELWGESATARLCQILVEANDGMAQQISENKTNLLDLLNKQELERVDDSGLNLCYLCVHYDRPDMVRYLYKRGLDFSKTCDPMDFGTPMFYAVNMGRIHIIKTLNELGVSVSQSCDSYMNMKPSYYASIRSDESIKNLIEELIMIDRNAYMLFRKNFLKRKQRRLYLLKKKSMIKIQRFSRSFLKRLKIYKMKLGLIDLYEEEEEDNDENETETGLESSLEDGSSYAESSSILQSIASISVHNNIPISKSITPINNNNNKVVPKNTNINKNNTKTKK